MPTDRKLDEKISGWLEADAPRQLPDFVLRATFERTRRTRQQGRWQALLGRAQMNRSLALGGAAVVIVAGALALGIPRTGSGPGGPPPSVAPSIGPSAAPSIKPSVQPSTAAPSASQIGNVKPGPLVVAQMPDGGAITTVISNTGWNFEDGILSAQGLDDTGMLVFAGGLSVYGDACHWSTTKPAKPATTVNGIVTALGRQPVRGAPAPVAVSVAGHAGKAITLRVPNTAVFSTCDSDTFGILADARDPDQTGPSRYNQGPGQIDEFWVVDVKGVPVTFDLIYWPDTPQAVIDELRAIVMSATFAD